MSMLVGLVLAAYAWIFKNLTDRLKKVEAREDPVCHYPEINEKIISHDREIKDLKNSQDKMRPVLMDINKTLGELKEAISWIKNSKK